MAQSVCASSRPATSLRPRDGYYSSIRVPYQSTSRPIFTADPLAFKRDKKSSAISLVVHVVIIALVLSLALKAHTIVALQPATIVTPVDFKLSIPPMTMPVARLAGGGGGGGAHEMVETAKEELPTIVKLQTMAPQIIRVDQPKLAIEPSMQVKMPESNSLPALGMAHAQQISLASQGRGSGSGLGQGLGGGIGAGHGSGAGPGSGGGYGGGLMNVGGGVAAPEVIHSVEPEFTEDARRANFQGSVSIKLIVDSQGNPQNVQLVHHLGMGLDEKAIEAVRQYRFKPAMYQGHPVSVQIVIEMNFHLH
jgi:protein TonB